MTKKNVVPKKASNQHKRPTQVAKFKAAMLKAGATKEFVSKAIEALKPKLVKVPTLTRKEVARIAQALQLHTRIVLARGSSVKCYTLDGYKASCAATKRNKPWMKKLAKKA